MTTSTVALIPDPTAAVLGEVAAERGRQDAKWGQQNHPDGTGPYASVRGGNAWEIAGMARAWCQHKAAMGKVTWLDILTEETAEAFAEDDRQRLRAELIQVAAVAVAWIEDIDRRPPETPGDVS